MTDNNPSSSKADLKEMLEEIIEHFNECLMILESETPEPLTCSIKKPVEDGKQNYENDDEVISII